MDNNRQIIKTAYLHINKNEQNMFKVAGILSFLKTKIRKLFDKDYARKANDLIERTDVLKKILSQTGAIIREIEENIANADIVEYEANIQLLKGKLRELYSYFGEFENKKNALPSPATKGTKRQSAPRAEINEELASIYKGKQKLSELGVTAEDIEENSIGPKGIFASWALVSLVKQGEDPKKLEENQKPITDDDIRNVIYGEIPNMIIQKIYGRYLGKDGEKKGGGDLEIRVVSNSLKLPKPFDNWQLTPVFYLIDKRQNVGDPLKYKIFRQLIVKIENTDTGKYEEFDGTQAAQAENKLQKLKGFNA